MDGGVCERASPWQMGPHGILRGVVPPYGKPQAPDGEQKLMLQLSVFVPPAPAGKRVLTPSSTSLPLRLCTIPCLTCSGRKHLRAPGNKD